MRRGLILTLVVMFAAALALAGAYLYRQELIRWAVERYLPGGQVAELSADDFPTLRLTQLRLAGENWSVRIEQAQARLSPLMLLAGSISVVDLHANGVRVDIDTTRNDDSPPPSIDLPIITVQRAIMRDIIVSVDDTEVQSDELTANVHLGGKFATLNDVDTAVSIDQTRSISARGWVQLNLEQILALRGDLAIERSIGERTLAAQMYLQGDARQIEARFAASSPVAALGWVYLRRQAQGFSVDIETEGFQWPPLDAKRLVAHIPRIAQPLPLTLSLTAELPTFGAFELELQGQLDRGREFTGTGTLESNGQLLAVSPRVVLDPLGLVTEYHGEQFDLTPWLSNAPTRLEVTGVAEWQNEPASARMDLTADGYLLREPLQLTASAEWRNDVFTLDHATLINPGNRLQASGNSRDGLNIDAQLTRLSGLRRDLSGSIRGRAQVTDQRFDVDLTAENLAFRTYQTKQLAVKGVGEYSGAIQGTLQAKEFGRDGDVYIDAIDVDASGTLDEHRLAIKAQSPIGAFSSGVTANYLGRDASGSARWRNIWSNLRLNDTPVGDWNVPAPLVAELTIAEDNGEPVVAVTAEPSCANGPDEVVMCIERFAFNRGEVSGQLDLRRYRLANLNAWLDRSFTMSGLLDAQATFAGNDVRIIASIDDGAVRFRSRDWPIEVGSLQVDVLGWQSAVPNMPLQVRAALRTPGIASVSLRAERHANQRISGDVDINVEQFAPFQFLLGEGLQVDGNALLNVQFDGTEESPGFTGGGEVNAVVLLADTDLPTIPIHASLRGVGDVVKIDATSPVGDKLLHLNGEAVFGTLTDPQLTLNIVGSELPVLQNDDLNAIVSPDLQLKLSGAGAAVTGKVAVDEANITFAALETDPGLSNDVVIHRADTDNTGSRFPIRTNLQLNLGSKVRFVGAGLSTRLTGGLRLRMNPDRPLELFGNVATADGTFEAYGVELTIERGRLDFSGAADNPAVSLRASRTIERDKAGVVVSGYLRDLNTQLFAEPPKSPTETLSLVITGKSLDSASDSDLAKVSGAGVALGLASVLPVTEALREKLSLDELSIESPLSETDSSIAIGKQLGDRLHARYAYSIFNRSGGLILRYKVTDRLSLSTETSAETQAVDVLWQWQSVPPTVGTAP